MSKVSPAMEKKVASYDTGKARVRGRKRHNPTMKCIKRIDEQRKKIYLIVSTPPKYLCEHQGAEIYHNDTPQDHHDSNL